MDRNDLLRPLPESEWSDELSADLTGNMFFTIGVYLTLGAILKTFAVPIDEAIMPIG